VPSKLPTRKTPRLVPSERLVAADRHDAHSVWRDSSPKGVVLHFKKANRSPPGEERSDVCSGPNSQTGLIHQMGIIRTVATP
jgi:hypothetical protein